MVLSDFFFLTVCCQNVHVCVHVCARCPSGLPGVDAHVPNLSFSAALTVPMEKAGTILFDKVFVNEGNFYDPKTGKRISARFP